MNNFLYTAHIESKENYIAQKIKSPRGTSILESNSESVKHSRNGRESLLIKGDSYTKSQVFPNFQKFSKSNLYKGVFKINNTVDMDTDTTNSNMKKNHSRIRFKNYFLNEKEEYKCNLENCKNKNILLKYENMIQQMNLENERLKNINECFMISNSRKDEYISSLLKKNGYHNLHILKNGIINKEADRIVKKSMNYFETQKENSIIKYDDESIPFLKSPHSKESNKIKEKTNINNRFSLQNIPKFMPQNLKLADILEIPRKKSMVVITPKISSKNNIFINPDPNEKNKQKLSYYDKIVRQFAKKIPKTIRDTRTSYLSISEDLLCRIINTENYKELQSLTSSYEEFVKAMRVLPEEKLFSFSDSISTIIKDFEYSINLIKRVKKFLEVSVRVVNTTIIKEAVDMLIKNTCEILDCERASVYVYEKITNMLIIHAGEEFRNGEWKMPIDKGIVGYVFTNEVRQKIDDAYSDKRFNKEVDKQTGFTTKSMLCVPLKDEYGKSFGVIQGLNKKGGFIFSADDEELLDIFANQASAILQNSIKFDENMSYISRFKMLLRFNLQINSCDVLEDFCMMCEKLLALLWATNNSQILILDKNENNFIKIVAGGQIERNKGIGIVGMVYNKKEIFAINSTYDNPLFNNLIDLETGFPLVTFPIFDLNHDRKILAICQVGYPHKTVNNSNKPKEMDVDVINFFCQSTSYWLSNYFLCKFNKTNLE